MNNMKKCLSFVLVLVMVLSLAACGSKDSGSQAKSDNHLTQVKNKGELVIGMEGNWAPWTYHGDDDQLTGFDKEVGDYIASKLGVKANFIEGEWDGLLAGVKAGRYDMVINGVDVTDDRRESYAFSDAYAYIGTVLVVSSDNDTIKSMDDLKGKTTANSIGSTYMEIAEQYGATVSGVDTLDETIQMVLQGRVDATLNADQSILDYLSQHPDAPIKIVCYAGDVNEIAIPMVKDDDNSLVQAVNEAIAAMHSDGTLTELSMKYFGLDISKK